MSEKTTELEKVKKFHSVFTWGIVTQIWEVGEYAVAAYHPYNEAYGERFDENETSYHVWVNGRDTAHSFDTLDAALAFGMAYKADGPNTQAHRYFIKGLGLEK